MKFFALPALLFTATVFGAPAPAADAIPADVAQAIALERRQIGGSTSNEFLLGGCKPVIMAYARGSTELGNVVRPFPPLSMDS